MTVMDFDPAILFIYWHSIYFRHHHKVPCLLHVSIGHTSPGQHNRQQGMVVHSSTLSQTWLYPQSHSWQALHVLLLPQENGKKLYLINLNKYTKIMYVNIFCLLTQELHTFLSTLNKSENGKVLKWTSLL